MVRAMKTALLLLVCCGVAESHIDILAALHKGVPQKKFDVLSLFKHKHKKKKADDPTGILSQIMAASSAGLASAEQAHEKAVKATRNDVQALIQKEGVVLSAAVVKFNTDLVTAQAGFELARNASQAALDKDKAKAMPASVGWDSSAQLLQSKLFTQISFAERDIRKAERKRQYAVKEATSRADQLLEDAVRTLSRKTGDLTEMVKAAQSTIDEAIANVGVEPPAREVSLAQKSGSALDMKSAGEALAKAKTQANLAVSAAQKSVDAALEKVEKELTTAAKLLEDSLVKEQEEEIAGVRAINPLAAVPAPQKKSLRHK
jgi:hypothetical protein